LVTLIFAGYKPLTPKQMKKIMIVAAVAAFTMASCKKDYTCTCKDSDTGATKGDDIVLKGTAKKKDAESVCNTANTTYGIAGYSCTLDI
jgi:hypothetical protein